MSGSTSASVVRLGMLCILILAAPARRWGNRLSSPRVRVHHPPLLLLSPLSSSGLLLNLSLPPLSVFVCLTFLLEHRHTHTTFITMPGTSDCSILSLSLSLRRSLFPRQQTGRGSCWPLIRWMQKLLNVSFYHSYIILGVFLQPNHQNNMLSVYVYCKTLIGFKCVRVIR